MIKLKAPNFLFRMNWQIMSLTLRQFVSQEKKWFKEVYIWNAVSRRWFGDTVMLDFA